MKTEYPHLLKVMAAMELEEEIISLKRLGLTDEDIEGYIYFVSGTYPELTLKELLNEEESNNQEEGCRKEESYIQESRTIN